MQYTLIDSLRYLDIVALRRSGMAAARAAFIVGFAFGRTKHIGPHCAGLMRELVGLSSGLILAALVSTAAWMLGSYGVRFGCAP